MARRYCLIQHCPHRRCLCDFTDTRVNPLGVRAPPWDTHRQTQNWLASSSFALSERGRLRVALRSGEAPDLVPVTRLFAFVNAGRPRDGVILVTKIKWYIQYKRDCGCSDGGEEGGRSTTRAAAVAAAAGAAVDCTRHQHHGEDTTHTITQL